jgi:ribosomal protein S18 acetylase RimI-like enzyme
VAIAVVQLTSSDQVLGQVAALFDDYRAHYGLPPSPRLAREWLHEQLAQHRMMIAAAVDAGQACGFITTMVMPASLMLGTAWSIRDLYVAPRHRRSGIAHALLQHVVSGARAAGASRVSVQTEADNGPALRLYTAVGLHPVSDLELLNLHLSSAGGSGDGSDEDTPPVSQ